MANHADREHFVFLEREELQRARSHAARSSEGIEIRPTLRARIREVWNKEGGRGIALRYYWYARTYLGKFASARAVRSLVKAVAKMMSVWKEGVTGISFTMIVDEISWAQHCVGKPDFVFFLYLDMMSEKRRDCRYLAEKLNSPWAGILFHPRHDGKKGGPAVERYLQARNACGAAFLNPHSVAPYRARLRSRVFGVLPDVTEFRVAPYEVELVTRLRAAARGRAIVLLVGSIAPHKGLLPLIQAMWRADPEEFFFAIVGEIFWESYGKDEQFVRQFAANPPEHCLLQAGYIEDETELNAVIAASDVYYAVYANFRDSSNSLTKASYFEKPILVSDDYLMGERVRQYRLGLTVPYGDVDAILAALRTLRSRPEEDCGFADYLRDHSTEVLKVKLGELLNLWLGAGTAEARAVPQG